MLGKMRVISKLLINIPFTIYFNFRYLPLSQAFLLPIVLFNPKLIKLKGEVKIESSSIRFGMIKLGIHNVSVYPDNGISFENNGGTIVFKGTCVIGSNSFISIGSCGYLEFGDDFVASSSIKLVCYHYVAIGNRVRFGWECMVMDTGFHPIKSRDTGQFIGKAYGPIKLGNNNWFANGVLIMKNTKTVDFCIFGARSVLSKNYCVASYSLLIGSPPKLVRSNVYRDMDDCTETYVPYSS